VDLVDDTFVVCDPAAVAQVVADARRWAVWWPDLRLSTTRDRGLKGRQWAVQGALVGTAEIWLEPWWDGVILHFYLRADVVDPPTGGPGRPARTCELAATDPHQEHRRRAQQWKMHVHRLKDELERGRRPGEPARVSRADAEG
jgi:hypothetical protein